MVQALVKVFLFLVVFCIGFMWVGYKITEMTGGEKSADASSSGVTAERGEELFWGKGTCSTCHSVGGQGSGVRCPNLGVAGEKFPLEIGERAIERAKERSEKTGKHFDPIDYLLECMGDPPAYVVEGYKAEMPVVFTPPVNLSLDEVKSIVLYLANLGGDAEPEIFDNLSEVGQQLIGRIEAAKGAGGGDPSNGEMVFFDDMGSGNCQACHVIGEEGNPVGPNLSQIGLKELDYIKEKILNPNKSVVEGFEAYQVKTETETILGIKKSENADEVELIDNSGEPVTIPRADIKEMVKTDKSIMPADYREIMTIKELQDLTAYLLLQKKKG